MGDGFGESFVKETAGKARCEITEEFLGFLDILVDGEFMMEQKDIRLKFRGSANQRILDMKKSMKEVLPLWNPKWVKTSNWVFCVRTERLNSFVFSIISQVLLPLFTVTLMLCGYVYEGAELPADYICPICKHGVDAFVKN